MPFTNVWDTAFPPDTQLANLLGQDLRNFRLDVQQRMGSMSGLDAAKPPFNTDAQPGNWNGFLFFATDTHKIYQWTSPNWVDVTTQVGNTSPVIFKDGVAHVHTGTTTTDTIYTVNLPILLVNSVVRFRLSYHMTTQSGVSSAFNVFLGASSIASVATTSFGIDQIIEGYIFNRNSLVSQVTNSIIQSQTVATSLSVTTAINTGVATLLTVTAKNNANTDSQTFNSLIVELL